MGLQIFGNLDRNTVNAGLVISGTNLNAKVAPNFVAGDNVSVDIFLTSNDGIQDIQTYTAQRLAIGPINAKPTGGTYKIDYGGSSNSTLNFDASAQDFANAITNNAPSVPTPVTGTQIAPFTYIIDFGSNGTCSLPTVDSSGLTPSSAVSVQRLVTGDSSTKEQWLVRLFQNPIAFINSGFTNFTDSNNNKGIRGSLNLATEGVYDLLDANESALSTIELELTDSNGNVQTIFQTPITILADVIGLGSSASAGLPSALPASAITFLNTFPNPTFVNDVIISGGAELQVGSFVVDSSTGNITSDVAIEGDITGEVGFDGEVTFQDTVTFQGDIVTGTSTISRITTGEIQCPRSGNLPTDASPIKYDAAEHRFRDYDEDPQNLMVIKKLNGKNGARVGINVPASQDPKCALHVSYGGSSDGLPREALRVTGGAMFNEWVRIGHFTDTERNALTTPTNGTVIYNEDHDELQVYIGGAQGSQSKWQAISVAPTTSGSSGSIYPIWAEESGDLADGLNEWSFGNGDDTPASQGIPIGFKSKLLKISINVELQSGQTTTEDVEIEVYKNGSATGVKGIVTSGLASSDTKKSQVTDVSSSDLTFNENDIINFKTNKDGNASMHSARICAWMQNL